MGVLIDGVWTDRELPQEYGDGGRFIHPARPARVVDKCRRLGAIAEVAAGCVKRRR
jgi:hypothetical protein